MRWSAGLSMALVMLAPAVADAQGGDTRGVISCGTGRQVVYATGPNDVVTQATVDGRPVALPSDRPILASEMEAYCGPGSPAAALAALRANAEMDASGPIRRATPSGDPATRTMDAALGAPESHPLRTPGLPQAAVETQTADPDWEACARRPDPNGCRAALLDARGRDERSLTQVIARAWREDGVGGLLRLAHESWLLYGLLAVAALFAVPRLIRKRGG